MSNSSFEFQDIETKVEKNIDNATSEHWKKKHMKGWLLRDVIVENIPWFYARYFKDLFNVCLNCTLPMSDLLKTSSCVLPSKDAEYTVRPNQERHKNGFTVISIRHTTFIFNSL